MFPPKTNLRLVGNRSTITQYTVLIPSDVKASNMHDNTRFSNEFRTKYNPIVTAPATTKLNTVMRGMAKRNAKLNKTHCLQTQLRSK